MIYIRAIHLQFKSSQARLCDFKRQFILAAMKYLDLSYVRWLHISERTVCLIEAVTCAVLAPG